MPDNKKNDNYSLFYPSYPLPSGSDSASLYACGKHPHPIEPTFMHVMDTHTSMSYHRTIMACHHTFVAYLSCKSVVINPSSIVKIQ